MRLSAAKTFLLFFAPLLSDARPFLPTRPESEPLQRRAKYSVVNVDGSSSVTTSAAPVVETVVHTVTAPASPAKESDKTIIIVEPSPQPPPATETIIATVTIKEPASVKTTVVTLVPSPVIIATAISTHSSSVSSSKCTTSTRFESAAGHTSVQQPTSSPLSLVSVVSASTQQVTTTSTRTHDDGMWHTYYPIKVSSAATSNVTSTIYTGSSSSLPSSTSNATKASLTFPALSRPTPGGFNSTSYRRHLVSPERAPVPK